MAETVLLEQVKGVIVLTLNRPDAYNSLDVPMLEELLKKIRLATTLEENILILKGNGKGFSAGGDIVAMLSTLNTPFTTIMDTIGDVVTALYTMPKLTICAIHGAAAGLGLSMALACDYVLVEKNAKIAMNFISIGLVPDGGGHFFLQKRVGDLKAKGIIWNGETLSADEAYEMGIIDHVTNQLETSANEKVEEWRRKPIKSMIATKNILIQQNIHSLKQTLLLEAQYQGEMRATIDHQEGIRAFVEKRKPHFIGK